MIKEMRVYRKKMQLSFEHIGRSWTLLMLKEMQINCIKFVSEMTFTTLIDRDKKKD